MTEPLEAKFSPPTGKYLAMSDENSVRVYDTDSLSFKYVLDHKSAYMSFSPKGTYILTCSKPMKGENNLKLWNLVNGKLVGQYEFKKNPKEAATFCQWTPCESIFCRLSSAGSIDLHLDSESYTHAKEQIRLDKIERFAYCPIPES